jgi:hypothetical protein
MAPEGGAQLSAKLTADGTSHGRIVGRPVAATPVPFAPGPSEPVSVLPPIPSGRPWFGRAGSDARLGRDPPGADRCHERGMVALGLVRVGHRE